MRKILFISHQASRTGAPMVLLHFVKWLKENHPKIKMTVLSLEGGVISKEFKIVVDEYFEINDFQAKALGLKKSLANRILKKFGRQIRTSQPVEILYQQLASQDFDVIYSNTVVSIPVAHKIKKLSKKSKLVLHVHELGTIIKIQCPYLDQYIAEINGFIAVSELVKKNLTINCNIPTEKVEVIREFTVLTDYVNNIKDNIFTVGASGYVHWRKGNDLFIQVAGYIKKNHPLLNMKFIWVGGISRSERIAVEADIEKADLSGMVFFVGEKENPVEIFNDFDVFLLPSREDPFPLVCIEVGMLGKPIICFEKATGTAEVLERGGGEIVPYLDVQSMAEEVISYYKNPEKRQKDGEINKQAFKKFTPEVICPSLYQYLNRVTEADVFKQSFEEKNG